MKSKLIKAFSIVLSACAITSFPIGFSCVSNNKHTTKAASYVKKVSKKLTTPVDPSSLDIDANGVLKGFKNRTIPSGFASCDTLTIPSSVKAISSNAFYGMTSPATNIDVVFDPACECTVIGYDAFINVDWISSITISSKLQTIGESAFESSSLKTINLSNATSLVTISNKAFAECTGVSSIDISKCAKLQTIGTSAFAHINVANADITFPSSLVDIGANAFQGCSFNAIDLGPCSDSLHNVYKNSFGNSPGSAFDNTCLSGPDIYYDKSKTVNFGCQNHSTDYFLGGWYPWFSSTKVIACDAFNYRRGWQWPSISPLDIKLPNLHAIGTRAFAAFDNPSGSGLKQIFSAYNIVSDKLTYIGDEAFDNNSGVKNIFLPSSVEYIGKRAFARNPKVETFDISGLKNLSYIGDDAFNGIPAFKTLDLSGYQKLNKIGIEAFINCTKLTEITLPKSLVTIEQGAFSGCSSLAKVNLSDSSCTTINANAFVNCKALTSINFPKTLSIIGLGAFSDSEFTDITFGWDHQTLVDKQFKIAGMENLPKASAEGCTIYIPDDTTKDSYYKKFQTGEVSFPDSYDFETTTWVGGVDPAPVPTPKNNTALPIGLGLGLGIPAVCGIGFLGFFFYKKKKNSGGTPTNNTI